MTRLKELRVKYGFDGGNYEPKPGCKFCRGSGERRLKNRDEMTFCICLYVDHSVSDIAGDTLASTARKLRSEGETP